MKHFFRTPLLLAAIGLGFGGCATMQQASELQSAVGQAQHAAEVAGRKADAAAAKAEQALRVAEEAKALAEQNRERINRAFRKAVQK